MQSVFYIVLGVLSSFSTSLSYKLGSGRKQNHLSSAPLLCGLVTPIIASAYLIIAILTGATVSWTTVLCALLGGFCYFIAAFCYLNALNVGPFTVTAGLLNFSALMPTVYSVVLLKGQSMTAIQIAGFFLLVVSVVLLAASKKTTQTSGKASWKWLLWMIPMFITNSIINFASRLQIYLTGSGESFSYTALCYGFSFLLCVFSFFALGGLKVTGKEKVKHYFLPAFCLALSLGANMLAHLRLPALNIPAAIQYPVISGSSTILAMIVGITVFHEKIRFYGYFAIAGGIAAMVLLNM